MHNADDYSLLLWLAVRRRRYIAASVYKVPYTDISCSVADKEEWLEMVAGGKSWGNLLGSQGL